ncbi:histone-like nucleoid-structuring protein Lsr2 [Humibacter soli]
MGFDFRRALRSLVRMAKKTTVVLVDDIDGVEIENGKGETVFFAIDGVSYEIDLTDENASALRAAVQPYVESGRRAARSTRPALSSSRGSRASREDLGAAREWLRAHGHKVSDRGRIPAPLLEEYRANS